MSKTQSFVYYQAAAPEDLFDVKTPRLDLPGEAKIFDSYLCESCGELTGANWIRIRDGKKLCIDCYPSYDRFHV